MVLELEGAPAAGRQETILAGTGGVPVDDGEAAAHHVPSGGRTRRGDGDGGAQVVVLRRLLVGGRDRSDFYSCIMSSHMVVHGNLSTEESSRLARPLLHCSGGGEDDQGEGTSVAVGVGRSEASCT